MNPIGPGGNRPNVSVASLKESEGRVSISTKSLHLLFLQFPMGPGPDGPMGAMGAMEPHHMNGSLGGLRRPKAAPEAALLLRLS